MFHGLYIHTLDKKGRVSVPSQFREIIKSQGSEKLVITKHLSFPCLICYSYNEWRRLEDKLSQLSIFDPSSSRLIRMLVTRAKDAPIDGNGRILIPQDLRDVAGIDREVVWAGMNRVMELWSVENWQKEQQSITEEDLTRVVEIMKSIGT